MNRFVILFLFVSAATAIFVASADASRSRDRPDNRPGPRGVAPFESTPVIGATSVIARDFNWRDAGIAAGTIVALALAATGGLVVVRRYRTVTQ
jgi:hypothetical protein